MLSLHLNQRRTTMKDESYIAHLVTQAQSIVALVSSTNIDSESRLALGAARDLCAQAVTLLDAAQDHGSIVELSDDLSQYGPTWSLVDMTSSR